MSGQPKSERREPKAITLPTDVERLLWNAVLYLTFATMGAVIFKNFFVS